MDSAQTEQQRQRLLGLRREIAGDVVSHTRDSFSLGTDGTQDVGDAAANTAARQLLLGLGERERGLLRRIDATLDRLDKGTYGICEECGDDIGNARLRALPHAALCVECKAVEEQQSRS